MKKISEFFTNHKYAIIWTVCYIFTMWLILNFMFGFNMFSSVQWHHLMRAELHGFGGFVFGLMLLAALPLYIATTAIIIRTRAPLIKIPLPQVSLPKFLQKKQPESPAVTTTQPEPEPDPDEHLPDDLPSELRAAFLRGRNNAGRFQQSVFDLSHMTNPTPDIVTPAPVIAEANTPAPTPETQDIGDIPLPSDFDIDLEPDNDTPDAPWGAITAGAAPTFTDINFDTTPTPAHDTTTNPVAAYLTSQNKTFETIDDIVIYNGMAISAHTDPDFWVADSDSWFAAGKQTKSPIVAAQTIATARNLTPAIYLGSQNIMDIDSLKEQWSNTGIKIITDLSEL